MKSVKNCADKDQSFQLMHKFRKMGLTWKGANLSPAATPLWNSGQDLSSGMFLTFGSRLTYKIRSSERKTFLRSRIK